MVLDFITILGQAGSVMLLIYGAVLVLLPARAAPAPKAQQLGLHHA